MNHFYLIRHGTTECNKESIFQGTLDTALSSQGLLQAEYLRKRFENIPVDAIYSSPLSRAAKTAEILKGSRDMEIHYDDRLKEIFGGVLQGYSTAVNMERYPEEMKTLEETPAFFAAPGGESSREVYDRMKEAIEDISSRYTDSTIAVVTHGFAMQMFIGYLRHMDFEESRRWTVGNCSVTSFYVDGNIMTEDYTNDESHIPEKMRYHLY